MKADLEDRIADAFGADFSSTELADLLKEVGLTDVAAKEASRLASDRALDPMTRPAEVAAARQQMADADFRSKRFAIATEKLSELHRQAVRREEAAAREKAGREAAAERDTLAKDLREYEALSLKIVNLLVRLQASNARVSSEQSAEVIARDTGLPWITNVDQTLPKLLESTRLPKFRRDGSNSGYLWPQQSRF